MSYSIVYIRQFLRLPDGRIIPLVLIGSNNTTEGWGKWTRRARDWHVLHSRSNQPDIAFTEKELLARFQAWTGGNYQEHFKFHGKWVDDAGLIRFAKKGIREAMTLEELYEKGYNVSLSCGFSRWETVEGKEYESNHYERCEPISNSRQLLQFIAKTEKRIQAAVEAETEKVYIELSYGSESDLYKMIRGRQQHKLRLVDNYYIIQARKGYISRLTAHKIKMTPYHTAAKQFNSLRKARSWLKEYGDKISVAAPFGFFHVLDGEAIPVDVDEDQKSAA